MGKSGRGGCGGEIWKVEIGKAEAGIVLGREGHGGLRHGK